MRVVDYSNYYVKKPFFLKQRNIPLLIAYIVFPFSSVIGNLFFSGYFRQWIDFAWIILGIISVIVLLYKGKIKGDRIFLFLLSCMLIYLMLVSFYSFFHYDSLITFLISFKVVFFIFIATLYAYVFGLPSRKDFVLFGFSLSWLLILGSVVELLTKGELIRPNPTGEINYEAALLLLSIVISTSKEMSRGKLFVIVAAVLMSMSRTALLVLAIISFIKFKTGLLRKVLIVVFSIVFFFASYFIRGLEVSSLEQIDRFWMWKSWLDAQHNASWGQVIFGYGPGSPINVDVPDQLSFLWEKQQGGLGLGDIYSFQFHAFWARFSLDYGFLLALLVVLFYFFKHSRDNLALMAFVILEGMTMGLFYLSNVAIPVLLAIMLMMSSSHANRWRCSSSTMMK